MSNSTISIASWNVNSLRRRIEALGWLAAERKLDILCLQETKVVESLFPSNEIAALGYPHQAFAGIKAVNGVAILSKFPLLDVEVRDWCGRRDCRHILAWVETGTPLGKLEVHSLYVPAGGNLADPVRNEKFRHKLEFLAEQAHWWAARGAGSNRVLAGDFNIDPLIADVRSRERLPLTVNHTEIEIIYLEHLRRAGGWIDAFRLKHPDDEPSFTCCSHRAGNWDPVSRGQRLDHIWISKNLKPVVKTAEIFKEALGWDLPSDHAPVIVTLDARLQT